MSGIQFRMCSEIEHLQDLKGPMVCGNFYPINGSTNLRKLIATMVEFKGNSKPLING